MMFSGLITADDIEPQLLTAPGMPRPLYRKVPIPATAFAAEGQLNIIESDVDQWREVIAQRQCDLCNEPLMSETRMYLVGERDHADDRYLLVRGGLHRHCYLATCNWCVHIRNRLLDGSMLACSLSFAATFDSGIFQILDFEEHEHTAEANVIGQYRVSMAAIKHEWPFKLGADSVLSQSVA
jgi:hypothetical protein